MISKSLKTKECIICTTRVPLQMGSKSLISKQCSVCTTFISIYIFFLLKGKREGLWPKNPITNLGISLWYKRNIATFV